MENLTTHLSLIVLLVAATISLVAWLRSGGRTRRDIFLNVGVLALCGILVTLAQWWPAQGQLLGRLALVAVLAHPYLLAVLSNHLVVIPRRLRLGIGAGLIAGPILLLSTSFAPPPAVLVVVGSYFLISEAYLTGAILKTGDGSGGITRSRLRVAALAPLMLVAAASLYIAARAAPVLLPMAIGLGHIILAGAAVLILAGFAPPRALRHYWRLQAMEDHVETSLKLPLGLGFRPIADHLMGAAVATTGATRSMMVLKPTQEEHFVLVESSRHTLQAVARLEGAMAQAWRTQRPVLVHKDEAATDMDRYLLRRAGGHALLIAPVSSRTQRWGLVLISYGWTPLFPKEDGEALELIGRHTAGIFEQGQTLEEQADLIHDLRLRSDALERSNEELRAFGYAVSHDLRTPLVTQMWLIEELQDELGPEVMTPHMVERFGQLQENMDGMWSLTADLLELARINTEPEEMVPIPLGPLVDEAVRSAIDAHPDKQVVFDVDRNALPVFLGDRVRLKQLFVNILGNAVKYGHDHGAEVKVSVRQGEDAPPGLMQICISDNGPGVPAGFHDRIFQVCIRAPDPWDRRIPGTGIGLAIAKKVAHQYDGDLRVADAPGGGACFVFEIPLLRLADRFGEPPPLDVAEPLEIPQQGLLLHPTSVPPIPRTPYAQRTDSAPVHAGRLSQS